MIVLNGNNQLVTGSNLQVMGVGFSSASGGAQVENRQVIVDRQHLIILIFGLVLSMAWPLSGYLALKLSPKLFMPGPSKHLDAAETEAYWRDYERRRHRLVMQICPAGFVLFLAATLIGAFFG